jgi:hypothetical protein
MKLHIENISIHIAAPLPIGLISGMALCDTIKPAANDTIPALGEKWPGTEATYAGISLSLAGDSLVHMLLWDADAAISVDYDTAVKHAEQVNPSMGSHLPTRHQSIDLYERLADRFNKDRWHWTLTKTPNGKSAFLQDFGDGTQGSGYLSAECRVRAVSEIPL